MNQPQVSSTARPESVQPSSRRGPGWWADLALLALLLLLPLHTLLMLLLDRAGVRGRAFGLADAWKDAAAYALLLGALTGAAARLRRGGRLMMRPADRLAVIYACVLVGIVLLPYRSVSLGQRMEGLRVDGLPLVFYGLGRLLPTGARLRTRLTSVALAVAGVLAAVGVLEWFISPMGLLRRLDYGGFVARTASLPTDLGQDVPASYFTSLGVRRSGSLSLDPQAFGQLCVIGAAAALAVHMIRRGRDRPALVVSILAVAGMAVARSRTSVAAYVVVAGVAALRAVAVGWGRRTVPVLGALSAAVAVVLIVAVPHGSGLREEATRPPALAAPAGPPAGAHPSLQSHIDAFHRTWDFLGHHPWGAGLGSNAVFVRQSGPLPGSNQLFILATEGGWLLLLLYALLLVALFGGLVRRGPDHRMASTTGLMFLLAALATGLTSQIFLNFALVALAFLSAGAGLPPVIEDFDEPAEPSVLVGRPRARASA